MRRNDVCLFFAKIRSTTQTANTSTALNEPFPSSLSHSATRSSFSLLESDSFLEIHCAFYRHRVFGEFSNQFSFFFFLLSFLLFGFRRSHSLCIHTYLAHFYFFSVLHDGEVGQRERYFATARSRSALLWHEKRSSNAQVKNKLNGWRWRRCGEVVTSELDGLCESFFSSFLSSSLSVHFIFLFVFWIDARIWNFFSSIFASLQFEEEEKEIRSNRKKNGEIKLYFVQKSFCHWLRVETWRYYKQFVIDSHSSTRMPCTHRQHTAANCAQSLWVWHRFLRFRFDGESRRIFVSD